MWLPITEVELLNKVQSSERVLTGELKDFWNLIKVTSEKWQEKEYGTEGYGFWILGICGQRVIWYNDIEEGFNISTFSEVGQINQYMCTQYNLREALLQLHQTISSKT